MKEEISIEAVKQEIEGLVGKFKEQSEQIHDSEHNSESTLLQIGLKLSKISSSMTEKEFTKFKEKTAKDLDFEKSSLDKVVKISRNSGINKNQKKLPAGWAALYLLCQIEPNDFDAFMTDSKVDRNTTRNDLQKMVDSFKEMNPTIYPAKKPIKKKEKLSIQQIISPSFETKSVEEFTPLLNELLRNNGWELVIPKEK